VVSLLAITCFLALTSSVECKWNVNIKTASEIFAGNEIITIKSARKKELVSILSQSTTKKSVKKKIKTKKPKTKKPKTKKPITKRPFTKKPIKKKPGTKKPITRKPVYPKKPITKKPITKKPATKKPIIKKPITRKPITKKHVTRSLVTLTGFTIYPTMPSPIEEDPPTTKRIPTTQKPNTTKIIKPTLPRRTTSFIKPLNPNVLKKLINRKIVIISKQNGLPFKSIRGIFAALKKLNSSPQLVQEVKYKVCPRLYSNSVRKAAKNLQKLLNKKAVPFKKRSKKQVCFGNGVNGKGVNGKNIVTCDQCCVNKQKGIFALPVHCMFCVCELNVTYKTTKVKVEQLSKTNYPVIVESEPNSSTETKKATKSYKQSKEKYSPIKIQSKDNLPLRTRRSSSTTRSMLRYILLFWCFLLNFCI